MLSTPGDRFERRRSALLDYITGLVRRQQEMGRIAHDESADAIAGMLQMLYLSAVRAWLRNLDDSVESGLRQLRDLYRLALRGLLIDPKAA